VEGQQLVGLPAPVVAGVHGAAAVFAHQAGLLRVAAEVVDGRRDRGRIVRIDADAAIVAFDDLLPQREARGDHRQPGRHVLEHLDRQRIQVIHHRMQGDQAGHGAAHRALHPGAAEVAVGVDPFPAGIIR